MSVSHCASVPMIQIARKLSDIAAQYCPHIAGRRKDTKQGFARILVVSMAAIKMVFRIHSSVY